MAMKNSNKRQLITSIMSLGLSVTMLMGTTLAWFTDNASTSVNTIQAGTLDIELLDSDDKDITKRSLNWKTADNREQSNIYWEPGATYDLETVTVKNNGNLALKYKVIITGINGDAELNDAIDWTINGADVDKEYSLAAGSESEITISGTMKAEATNEYQGKSIDGISISVVATQDTVEKDIKDNTYDKYATYDDAIIVDKSNTNASSLINQSSEDNVAINIPSNTSVSLKEGFTTSKKVTIVGNNKETSKVELLSGYNKYINTNGSDLVFKNVTVDCGLNIYQGIAHTKSIVFENCIINGQFFAYADNTTFKNCTFNVSGDNYNIWTYTSNVNFEDCKFNSDGKSVLIYNENSSANTNVNLTDCTFEATPNVKLKAAIEISGQFSKPTVSINNCTQKNHYGLWRVKDNNTNPSVTVNGEVQSY